MLMPTSTAGFLPGKLNHLVLFLVLTACSHPVRKGTGLEGLARSRNFISSPPYRKPSIVEESRGNDSPDVPDVEQLSGTRSGWFSSILGYDTHSSIQPSAAFTQVSSPSSVLMFQQASNPSPNFNPMHSFNGLEKDHGMSSFRTPEKYGAKLLLSGTGGHESRGRDRITMDSFCHSNDSIGDSQPLAAQPTFRTKQELASSCRIFGFSLTEGSLDATKEDNMEQATLSLGHGTWRKVPPEASIGEKHSRNQLY
ncbi:Transcriptional factor B3 family protein / auxin-responsive factor AUX/IAA-related isoform 3 [Hibiscus syriacus]|uniref:Transcriptional factor B3 family protein / auxin-responsive factor AUX/IAA-related isoform 3 n=1 Tax=Hibiscus syriacus TaxID=106335 RepID=A0A6A3BSV8_HIBSY|nr:Transcriptional factor B3 family protein / auxin-responsive factor AUX/IAA-related isoform 3 [Hibiscus syriacus]